MVYYTYARGPEHTDASVSTGLPASGTQLQVWTSDSGGTRITALRNLAGTALPNPYVIVDSFGRYEFRIESQANPAVWMKDPSGKFWQVLAAEILPQVPTAITNAAAALADNVKVTAQTLTGGQQSQARSNVNAAAKGDLLIRVNDYATPQLALDAAPAGAHVLFQGSYALSASLVVKADNQWIDAKGASFTMATWATPVFDAINRSGCTYDLGTITYTGTRGDHTGSTRGQAAYGSGCAVWINRDRNNVRSGRIIGMPTGAVCFSSWDGTGSYDRKGVGNKVGVGGTIEVSGYDFGVLAIWQQDLMIENLYGHDDIDDSSGANPTHVYYISPDATHHTSGLTASNVRAVNHLYGQPIQIRYCDGVTLTNHSSDNSRGMANFIDCNDVTVGTLLGTNCLANTGIGALTVQHITTPCKRFRASSISIQLAVNNDERAASIWVDDSDITSLSIETNHSGSVNTNLNTVVIRGTKSRMRSLTMRSRGAGHMRGALFGIPPSDTVSDWIVEDPVTDNCRALVDVAGGSTRVKVRYDPSVQTYTGSAAPVVVTGTPVGGELLIETPSSDRQEFMSSLGANPVLACLAGGTSLTFSSANIAILLRFTPFRSVTVSGLRWFTFSTSSGNYDIGIYTSGGTRLWSKGSTAWPAVNTVTVETVSPAVLLTAGVEYYLALAADNTSGTMRGAAESLVNEVIMLDNSSQWAKGVSSSFPLPSTITPGNTRSGRVPLIVVHGT